MATDKQKRPAGKEGGRRQSRSGRSKRDGSAGGHQGRVMHCLLSTIFPSGARILGQDHIYTLGRDHDCDVVLPHHEVSRRHAKLRWFKGSFRLKDLDSANGTFLNGTRLEETGTLEEGARLELGPFRISYRQFPGDVSVILTKARDETEETVLTGAPEPDAAGTADDGDVFGGKFSGLELVEVCQFLCSSKKSGVITVNGAAANGEIELGYGSLVRAEAGSLTGVAAARELLTQDGGSFDFFGANPKLQQVKPLVDTMPFLTDLCQEQEDPLPDLERL
ncbi:FHA domain-containing protein [Planctomycetota bacterium]